MREEDHYLVMDMKTYCSHVIVIFGETFGLPTAVIHTVFSHSNLDWNWNEQNLLFQSRSALLPVEILLSFQHSSWRKGKELPPPDFFLSRVRQ